MVQQVIQLIQLYWDDIYNNNPEKNNLWNGIVDAGSTLAGSSDSVLSSKRF